MKITNVSHYVSIVDKKTCAENIRFIIEGAKFEALACSEDSLALRHYKNWLKSAEVEKPSQSTSCPVCKRKMVPKLVCTNKKCSCIYKN